MQGLYYLLTLVGFGVIFRWMMQNDRLATGEETRGILKMERASSASANDKRTRRRHKFPAATG